MEMICQEIEDLVPPRPKYKRRDSLGHHVSSFRVSCCRQTMLPREQNAESPTSPNSASFGASCLIDVQNTITQDMYPSMHINIFFPRPGRVH